jgi:hypothetical protein
MAAQPILSLIDAAPAGTVFVANLKSLPYRAKDYEVESELKKCNAAYDNIEFKRDESFKLVKVKLTTNNKEKAKALMGLNKSMFMGRKLIVEFPDLLIDVDDLPEPVPIPVSNPVSATEPTPVPVQENKSNSAPVPAPEIKPQDMAKPTQPVEEVKDAPKPNKKLEEKPKQTEEIKVIEIPKETKSVWDLDISLQQSIIKSSKPTAQKQVTQTTAVKKEVKKSSKKSGKGSKNN